MPRKLLCIGSADVRARHALGASGDERLRWIGGADELRSNPLGEPFCERAGPASDVENAHPGLDPGELDQPGGELAGVAPP